MPTVPSEEFVRFGAALRRLTEGFAETNRRLVMPNFEQKWQQFKATAARSADLFVRRNQLAREDGLMLLFSVLYYYAREAQYSPERMLARIRHIYLTGNIELFPAGMAPLDVDVKHDVVEIMIAVAGHYGEQLGRTAQQLIQLATQNFGVWFEREQQAEVPEAPPIQGLQVDMPAGVAPPKITLG